MLAGQNVKAMGRLNFGKTAAALTLVVVLSACASLQRATITLGAGGSYWRPCVYESFRDGNDYGILQVLSKDNSEFVPDDDLPSEGATLSGDLTGFGVRTLHNDSANSKIKVKLVYHATSYEASLTHMQLLGCFK